MTNSPIHNRGTAAALVDPRLAVAAMLVAATGASRHPNPNIRNPTAYLTGSANAVHRAHADTWRTILATQPNATAEDLAYAVIEPFGTAPAPPTTRTIDGILERFVPGTGWTHDHTPDARPSSPPPADLRAGLRRGAPTS